jgi:hypothetical protein
MWWFFPSAKNASSGPYEDEDRPSAPSPIQAIIAIRAIWSLIFGLSAFNGLPINTVFIVRNSELMDAFVNLDRARL